MHAQSLTAAAPVAAPALAARRGGAAELARLLQAARRDTLATFAAWRAARPALQVPPRAELNPPLWELGHVGWFQSWWLARFPARALGPHADPDGPRLAPLRDGADALYDSGRVPHDRRWSLPLPDAETTLADLGRGLAQTLDLLAALPADAGDEALYFFRLALLHEDMHHEAALYMARHLDIDRPDARWAPRHSAQPAGDLAVPAGLHRLGSQGPGFAFDNELAAQQLPVEAFCIDRRARTWRDVLPFAEAGGYADARWWTEAGWQWRQQSGATAPRYLRRDGDTWLERRHGRWQPLDLDLPASHLTAHEAAAWCRWAGRRLPTELEWERAAALHPQAFDWGQVWEWTASAFAPYPGFEPHPYRDYSAPWFDGRPVLKGASHLTQPRLRHAGYRNYFTADRNDIAAGLRSCAA